MGWENIWDPSIVMQITAQAQSVIWLYNSVAIFSPDLRFKLSFYARWTPDIRPTQNPTREFRGDELLVVFNIHQSNSQRITSASPAFLAW